MRFNVPQFIDVEDKIVGPLSMKQFMIVIGAGVLLFFSWYIFQLWIVVILGILLAAILAAAFFGKVQGRSIPQLFLAWFNYFINPRVYVWRRKK